MGKCVLSSQKEVVSFIVANCSELVYVICSITTIVFIIRIYTDLERKVWFEAEAV